MKIVTLIYAPPSWITPPPLAPVLLKAYLEHTCTAEVRILDLNQIAFRRLPETRPRWLKVDPAFERSLFARLRNAVPLLMEKVECTAAESDAVGFTLTQRNTPCVLDIADRIVRRNPKVKIFCGGPQTLRFYLSGKFPGLRAQWVIGEGELPSARIIRGDDRARIVHDELSDLDRLPHYDFDYLAPSRIPPVLPLLSSRGCPGECAFCTERFLFRSYRIHSPSYVGEQIIRLHRRYRRRYFVFCDSLFNHSFQWLEEFCRMIIDTRLSIRWEAQMKIQPSFPVALARLLKKSGCSNLFIGLESGSDAVLQKMRKGVTAGGARSFFRTLRTAGIHFEISLIAGFPGERARDFAQTCRFLIAQKRLIPKIAQINPYLDYDLRRAAPRFPSRRARHRADRLAALVAAEKIPFTPRYINNLIQPGKVPR
ncbi:MAG: radical SAM protein [Candidatus Omnitrophica bacterium]|nr:radical SAM protein [Candidatus Omnitrophota bacterium]